MILIIIKCIYNRLWRIDTALLFDMGMERIYPSEIEAKRQTGVDNTMIHRYLKGNASYAGKLPDGTKLHWEYATL